MDAYTYTSRPLAKCKEQRITVDIHPSHTHTLLAHGAAETMSAYPAHALGRTAASFYNTLSSTGTRAKRG
eukprot:7609436-Alexandrium_andersonii.AAC.1